MSEWRTNGWVTSYLILSPNIRPPRTSAPPPHCYELSFVVVKDCRVENLSRRRIGGSCPGNECTPFFGIYSTSTLYELSLSLRLRHAGRGAKFTDLREIFCFFSRQEPIKDLSAERAFQFGACAQPGFLVSIRHGVASAEMRRRTTVESSSIRDNGGDAGRSGRSWLRVYLQFASGIFQRFLFEPHVQPVTISGFIVTEWASRDWLYPLGRRR